MKLPIGIQSFEKLRKNTYLYVDKTEKIYQLITSGNVFFLSRPRRFGKSLLVSTLEALFTGNKVLFEGLYIYDKVDWEQTHPVIRFDWSSINHSSVEEMEQDMQAFLKKIADTYQVKLSMQYAASMLGELIELLHRKTTRMVVVLVDEYDMPILDAISKSDETVDSIRDFLQSFYKVLKSADEHLRFVFLTGVSKFSKVSIFSGLNQLNDITLDTKYASICGYTQAELELYFSSYIDQIASVEQSPRQDVLDSIQHWYNGFSWDGITYVYNPFSILLLCSKKGFQNYWFETGTPTFLINIIKERNDVKLLLESSEMYDSEYNSFDYLTLDTKLLLFQTGYLTVKGVNKSRFGRQLKYTLGIPNEEVRSSLMEYLVSSFTGYPAANTATIRERMMNDLFDGNTLGFETSMKELFACIPYQLHIPREAYYHSLLLLWLNMLGFTVQAEVSTNKGRIDAVWIWGDRVVIAEIKFAEKGEIALLLEEAFSQINERCYYERYIGNYRIALLAIAFTNTEKSCRMQELVQESFC